MSHTIANSLHKYQSVPLHSGVPTCQGKDATTTKATAVEQQIAAETKTMRGVLLKIGLSLFDLSLLGLMKEDSTGQRNIQPFLKYIKESGKLKQETK